MGRNKSDKGNKNIISSWHNYTTFYYSIFKDMCDKNLRVFELGLGTNNINIVGVQVGSEFKEVHKNLRIIKYPKSFDKESKIKIDFPSMPNYDLKAFELCLKNFEMNKDKKILFWNVL